MALLSRDELIAALRRLGTLAAGDGESIDLLIVGGGLMVLEFGVRNSTKDLDGVVLNRIALSKVRDYAATIGVENNWPAEWLNDGAKGFLTGEVTPSEILSFPGIRVCRPSFGQLLAMKLCAWRDDIDIADAARLLKELPPDRDNAWQMVEPHLQVGQELKAKYAFEDLWELNK